MDFNQELERMLAAFCRNVFYGIKYGIADLRKRKFLIGFIGCFVFPLICFIIKDTPLPFDKKAGTVLRVVFLFFPLLYVYILGLLRLGRIEYYNKKFKEIQFIGKNQKYPMFISRIKKNGVVTYLFSSVINFDEWYRAKASLETALICDIIDIREGVNKRIVEIKTRENGKIPKYIKWDDSYLEKKESVFAVGVAKSGVIRFDINKNPHVLLAGTTGSGKSVILVCLLWQAILKHAVVYMIDFKGGVMFPKIYEQYGEVVTERNRALEILDRLKEENAKRMTLFHDLEVENIGEYNERCPDKKLARICVFCDEVAEMLDSVGVSKEEKELMTQIKGRISSLARLARATGINLFLATQRPDANVLPGQIKNNVDVRLCGRFSDKTASLIVLGNVSATKIENNPGRFIYQLGNDSEKFQSYLFERSMLRTVDEIGYKPENVLMQHNNKEVAYKMFKESAADSYKEEKQKDDLAEAFVPEKNRQKQGEKTEGFSFDLFDFDEGEG